MDFLDCTELQDLLGFHYENADNSSAEFPFLICPVRMGCDYCSTDFHISRGPEYPYFTLHVLFSGCSFFRIKGHEYLLKKGDAFLILAREKHDYRSSEDAGLGFLWIELDCTGCPELFHWFMAKQLHTLDAACTGQVARKLAEILRCAQQQPVSPFALSAMCYALIMDLYEAGNLTAQHQPPPLIAAALYYINSHFSKNPSVACIAAYLNISESCLTKQFKRHIGTTPARYLMLKKIEYAVFLLKNTALSCDAVAEQAGFFDAAHLYKVLFKNLGTPPSALRKNNAQLSSESAE